MSQPLASHRGASISDAVVRAFAPTGRLRASINVGNPILAGRNAGTGEPEGVSIDLASAFAEHLGVDVEWALFGSAAASVEAVSQGRADVGFFAIDPKRAESIAFTAPYLLIEGAYLVRDDSAITAIEEVDRSAHRVVVGKGSAYDLFLSRELKFASIERASTSPAVVEQFLATGADVAAGVRQQLEADARRISGLRLLAGHFMLIRQAMGCPRSRGVAAADALQAFVEEMKSSGFVAQALERHRIEGVSVAAAARGRGAG